MESVVRFIRIREGGQDVVPALVTGEILDPAYTSDTGKPALNLIAVDPANEHHVGAAEWQKGLQRITAVKNMSHADVQAGKESTFWALYGEKLPVDVEAAAKAGHAKLSQLHGYPEVWDQLDQRDKDNMLVFAAAVLGVEWNIPLAYVPGYAPVVSTTVEQVEKEYPKAAQQEAQTKAPENPPASRAYSPEEAAADIDRAAKAQQQEAKAPEPSSAPAPDDNKPTMGTAPDVPPAVTEIPKALQDLAETVSGATATHTPTTEAAAPSEVQTGQQA